MCMCVCVCVCVVNLLLEEIRQVCMYVCVSV
jgi:hypothetical protein